MKPPKEKGGPVLFGDSIPSSPLKTRATAEAWGKEGHFYKLLPIRFRHEGFDYRQIAREGKAAIYEQTWTGCPNPSICFEVVRIGRRDGFEIGGRFVEPAEVYPRSESWGMDAFTFTDKDAAFARLREIVESSNALTRFGQQEVE